MAIPYVAATATFASGSANYSTAITANTAAGDGITVVVGAGGVSPPALSTVTDSNGNTYTQQQQTSASPWIAVFQSANTSALNTTDTISFAFAGTMPGGIGVAVVGSPSLNAVDLNTTVATGSSTAPSVSGTPAVSGEIALALFVWSNASGAGSLTSPLNSLVQVHPTGGTYVTVGYVSNPTASTPLTAGASITSGAWRAMILSVKSATTSDPLIWFTNAAYIGNLHSSNASVCDAFFNTGVTRSDGIPAAFALSNSAGSPVSLPAGYTTVPCLKYIAYGQFWADVSGTNKTVGGITYTPVSGGIDPSYTWLMYDTENWNPNPPSPYTKAENQSEIDDPWTYMANFVTLAHTNHYKVLMPPARDLAGDPTSVHPLNNGETTDAWVVRTNLYGSGAAASGAEIVHVQAQADQTNGTYASFFTSCYNQAQAVAPSTPVTAGVSTTSAGSPTATDMFNAAQSVLGQAQGFWLNMSSGTAGTAIRFLQLMQAASPPPSGDATVTPDTLDADAAFPAPAVTNGTTAGPATLSAAAGFSTPVVSTGGGNATAAPATLRATAAFPAAAVSNGTKVPATTLAVTASVLIPAIGTPVVSPPLELSGFGTFPQIPVGATITSVVAVVTQFGSNASILGPTYELWDYSGTPVRIGSAVPGASSLSAAHTDRVTFTGVTYSQLPTLRLRVLAASSPSNTGATNAVDAALLEAVYALPAATVATPDILNVSAVVRIPSPKSGVTLTLSTLAILTGLPVPALTTNASANYATAAGTIAGGAGSWTATGSATGQPDAADAIWTVP